MVVQMTCVFVPRNQLTYARIRALGRLTVSLNASVDLYNKQCLNTAIFVVIRRLCFIRWYYLKRREVIVNNFTYDWVDGWSNALLVHRSRLTSN